jgi:hypothetical protein
MPGLGSHGDAADAYLQYGKVENVLPFGKHHMEHLGELCLHLFLTVVLH